MKTQLLSIICLTLFSALLVSGQVANIDRKALATAKARADNSAAVFNEIMSKPDSEIPQYLLDRAEAVIVIPGTYRAAFGFGGRVGKGVATFRTNEGWSEPIFVKLAGLSFGIQIGASKTDLILLVMNEIGLQKLLRDEIEIGGELAAIAGPVGREAAASTNLFLDAEILSYSKAKGLYIGAAIKGAKIYPDDSLNQAIYGKRGRFMITDKAGKPVGEMLMEVRALPAALDFKSPRKR
jgi:lipid-binding SYLF domain-containing protein